MPNTILKNVQKRLGKKPWIWTGQAISAYLGIKLASVKSELTTIKQSRAYIPRHIDMVAAKQSQKYALATAIAASAGLRAQELLTLRLATERPATGTENIGMTGSSAWKGCGTPSKARVACAAKS